MIDLFRRRSLEQACLAALASQPDAVAISPEERLLSQLDGLTYPQIVEQLGIPLRTVKRYMQQGFAQCLSLML